MKKYVECTKISAVFCAKISAFTGGRRCSLTTLKLRREEVVCRKSYPKTLEGNFLTSFRRTAIFVVVIIGRLRCGGGIVCIIVEITAHKYTRRHRREADNPATLHQDAVQQHLEANQVCVRKIKGH